MSRSPQTPVPRDVVECVVGARIDVGALAVSVDVVLGIVRAGVRAIQHAVVIRVGIERTGPAVELGSVAEAIVVRVRVGRIGSRRLLFEVVQAISVRVEPLFPRRERVEPVADLEAVAESVVVRVGVVRVGAPGFLLVVAQFFVLIGRCG